MKQLVVAFWSVKGGVGKSALAVAAAVGLARAGRAPTLIDADVSGTSLADGLALRAPDGAGGWLSRDESIKLRRLRATNKGGRTPPFLNDVVSGIYTLADAGWRHDDHPAIRFVPSSPTPEDAQSAVRQVFDRPTWFVDGLKAVARQAEGPVVLDLPPGMFGVTTAAAHLADSPGTAFVPVLVTTDDHSDLYRSVEVFFELKNRFPNCRWVLNRSRTAKGLVEGTLRTYLDDQWTLARPETRLVPIGWSADLEHLFKGGSANLDPALTTRLVNIVERGRP